MQRAKYPDIDLSWAVAQIAGRQRIKDKLPEIYADLNWELPVTLSLEQCSSETTAKYKAERVVCKVESVMSNVENVKRTMVDLTGGFGIDFHYCSRHFDEAHYVERNEELCRLAEHNLRQPEGTAPSVFIHQTEAEKYLDEMEHCSLIVVDPARRDTAGRKVAALSDCTPDLTKLHNLLTAKADTVLVKLSPMLDMHEAIRQLPETREVHIVSVRNECKELLLILRAGEAEQPIEVHCVNLETQEPAFCYTQSTTRSPLHAVTDTKFLYEPNASIMKAGCFHEVEAALGIRQLAENSHLYVTEAEVAGFPGRAYRIVEVRSFNKEDARALCALGQANISCRNFPLRPEELRKRLKLKDGGSNHLIATTDSTGKHIVFVCERI